MTNSGTHGTGTRSYTLDPGVEVPGLFPNPSGRFFEDEGASIVRLNDRLLIGPVSQIDASTLGGGADADWFSAGTGVSAGLNWVSFLSTVSVVSPNGTVGISAASRASDVPADLGTSQITIPFVGVAVMDRTGGGPPYWTSYGGYLEGRMEPVAATTGTVIGLEIDAINFGTVIDQSTPWRRQTLGGATGLWLASGGDPANHGRAIAPAQLAIGVINNGETWMAGLVMANNAIEGTDGTTGFGEAILLSTRHLLGWWGEGTGIGERVNYITSTSTVPGHSLQFQDGGSFFASAGGKIDFSVSNVANSVNGLGARPAVAGQAPRFESFGDDTDVDMVLAPKGAGNLHVRADVIGFYSDAGNEMSYLSNQVGDAANVNGLVFDDGGPFFYGLGSVVMGFGMVANAVNHLSTANAATGNPPGLLAVGTDSDVDILLDPQGSNGTLKLAVPTATSATAGAASALPGAPAAYLIVKDGAGTSLKIPAWNT